MSFTRSKFTGFPFDDNDDDLPFQDRLNDIAQRHPEFASHLRFDDFPSLRRKRTGSGSQQGTSDQEDVRFPTAGAGPSARFADHSFPSGFNRFPFSRHFEDEFASEPHRDEKPPEVPKAQQPDKRGRKPNPNLPQHLSNTVDLGQKQPPVEETRSQRSMSAPPENRTTHSSSPRVDSEQPQDEHQPTMGKTFSRQPPSSREHTPTQPKERIIPIHVEGRDEPIIPKNTHHANSSPGPERGYQQQQQQQPPPHQQQQQQQQHRHADPQANVRKNMYEQFMPQPPPTKQQHQQSPPQSGFTRQQTPPMQHPQQHQATPPPPDRPQRSQATPPLSNDPLDKIKCVRNDVMALMTNVEQFQGTRKDREYLYLDEMLTRNLLKLDDVETEGKENIRLARKEAIKCIQTCINNLEAKAQAREKQILKEGQPIEPMQTNEEDSAPMVTSAPAESSNDPPKFTSQVTLIISGSPKPGVEVSSSTSSIPAIADSQQQPEDKSAASAGSNEATSTPMDVATPDKPAEEPVTDSSTQNQQEVDSTTRK